MTRPTTVLHHAGCLDGFTAAWVLWRRFAQEREVVFEPASYGADPPWHLVEGRHVYVVDFSYPRQVLEEMAKQAASVFVIDHHKTARDDLIGLSYVLFDMERSGAGLAWDWAFHPKPRPWLVDYVEDRDLWAQVLPHSREVGIFLGGQAQTFENWDRLNGAGLEAILPAARACGDLVRAYAEELAGQAVEATLTTPAGGKWAGVPVVSAPHRLVSETLHTLLEVTGAPFVAGWSQGADGTFTYSLRSRAGTDVSVVARGFGGGGHERAAGFKTSKLVHEVVGG